MLAKYLIPVCIAGTLLLILIFFLLIFITINFRNKLNQHYLEKQALLLANLEEGERMMNQIAKEVHDNIGQVCHILFNILRKIPKTDEKAEQIALVNRSTDILNMIIRNVDNVSHSLNSDYIKNKGLSNILQEDIEHIKKGLNIICHLDFIGDIKPMDPDTELLIYRITQEAIHNALKHANATILKVVLSYSDTGFKIEIKDNGVGFNLSEATKRGIGLSNMKERANVLQGELSIMSEPGSGCSVCLSINNISL